MSQGQSSDGGAKPALSIPPVADPRQTETTKLRQFPRPKKALLVVGMHRSGTSAITRVLNLLGADLSHLLLKAVPGDNETGFWESAELYHLHEELLAAIGSSWDDVSPLPPGWHASEPARSFQAKVLEILRRDFAESSLFVVKDPRLARMLPVWRPILEAFQADPHFVLIVRNPLEVAASLKARNEFLPAKSHLLWLWHVLEAERETRGQRRSLVLYEELLCDWREVARRLESDLALRWPRQTAEAEVRIDEFLSPRLRHQVADTEELQAHSEVVDWAKRAYAALLRVIEGEGESLAGDLDRIRDELAAADVAFGPLIAEGRILLARSANRVSELETRLETRERDAERLAAEIAERERRAEAHSQEIGRLAAEVAARNEELTARQSEVERLRGALRTGQDQAENLAGEIAARDEELAAGRDEIERLAGRVRVAEAARDESRRAAEGLRQELGLQEREVGRLQREILEFASDLMMHSDLATHLGQRLKSRRWDARVRADEIRRLGDLADSRGRELRYLGETLSSVRAEGESLRSLLARSREREAALADELATIRSQLDRSRGKIAYRDEELAARQGEIDRLAGDLSRAGSGLRELEDRLGSLQSLLDRVLGSRSWRLTRPLRWLAARARSPLAGANVGAPGEGGAPLAAVQLGGIGDQAAESGRPSDAGERRDPAVEENRPPEADPVAASGLFDPEHYLSQLEDPSEAAADALRHYREKGVAAKRDPHPLFDARYYLECNPDVAEQAIDPLEHFVRSGGLEGRSPHPLFDTPFYLGHSPDVAAAGENPLVHYLATGAAEGRDPHPLFDTSYYLERNPDVAAAGENPLAHYLSSSAGEGRDPHPLFDGAYYLARHPQVAAVGENPLRHFVLSGAAAGLDPHPLFDTAYYLERHPQVAAAGENPLCHYLTRGAAEGCDPHRFFDTAYYLRSNVDVASSGANPLIHYTCSGAAEGRDPHPLFSTADYLRAHPEVAADGLNPLVHYLERGDGAPAAAAPPAEAAPPAPTLYSARGVGADRAPGRAAGDASRTILCVTHVPPYPPRAGNEYRLWRLLAYLQKRGCRVVLALAPLGGEEISEAQFAEIRRHFPYAVLCGRDGVFLHDLKELGGRVQRLDGEPIDSFSTRLGEDRITDPRERDLLRIDRTYCHDPLVRATTELLGGIGPCVLLAEYVFMTRLLPLVDGRCLKIVDTIDVFSSSFSKVVQFGVTECLTMSPEAERERLRRADLVLAIHSDEQRELEALAPDRRVIKVAVDFDVDPEAAPANEPTVCFLGSGNPRNVKGLQDFLTLAWSRIAGQVPDARLLVAGHVCDALPVRQERVRLLGPVADLASFYRQAKVVVNPSVAGTGLKIKTVEALCHYRPVVNWPSGVEGLEPELLELCEVAEDWHEFGDRVIRILRDPRPDWFSAQQRQTIRRALSPEEVYAPLVRELESFFRRPRPS